MTVCPHCQIQLNPGTTACPECGTQIPQGQQTTQQANQQQNYQQQPPQQSQQYQQQPQGDQQYQQGPGPQEQYCRGCGQIVHNQTSHCPNCGAQVGNDFNEALWIGGGVVSFVIGIIVLAIVFGPLTTIIGYKVYKERGGIAGPLLMVGGILEIVVWLAFVSMVTSSPYYYTYAAVPLA